MARSMFLFSFVFSCSAFAGETVLLTKTRTGSLKEACEITRTMVTKKVTSSLSPSFTVTKETPITLSGSLEDTIQKMVVYPLASKTNMASYAAGPITTVTYTATDRVTGRAYKFAEHGAVTDLAINRPEALVLRQLVDQLCD